MFIAFSCSLLYSCTNQDLEDRIEVNLIIPNRVLSNGAKHDVLVHNSSGQLIQKLRNVQDQEDYRFVIDGSDFIYFTIVLHSNAPSIELSLQTYVLHNSAELVIFTQPRRNFERNSFVIDCGDIAVSNIYMGVGASLTGSEIEVWPRTFPASEILRYLDNDDGVWKGVNIFAPTQFFIPKLDLISEVALVDSVVFSLGDDFSGGYNYLYGRRNEIDDYYRDIEFDSAYESGESFVEFLVPDLGFNDYLLHTEDLDDGFEFGSYVLYDETDFQYSRTYIDLTIDSISNSLLSFKSNNAKFFWASFKNHINVDYRIGWSYSGEVDQELDLTLLNMDEYFEEVAEKYNPLGWEPSYLSVYKPESEWTMEDFFQFRKNGILNFNIPSSMYYYSERLQ